MSGECATRGEDFTERRTTMRTAASKFAFFVLAVSCACSVAFAWGSATHAYIETRLTNKGPVLMINQVYGGMGADAFNYMFETPTEMTWLSNETHCDPLRLWRVALLPTAKAQAFGFVSHNNLWGVDSTAHFPACPPNTIPNSGYIFWKGAELEALVESDPTYGPVLYSLHLPPDLQAGIFQDLAEFGVDILVKRLDPGIGQKVSTAALLRSPEFPLLLVAAYGRGLSQNFGMSYQDAAKMITAEEAEFRKTIIGYGQALTQDEATATQIISENTAQLAQALLGAYGITLPPSADLVPILNFAISQAEIICAGDYQFEIDSTVKAVKTNLASHGISY
jgi:hypothetical protein